LIKWRQSHRKHLENLQACAVHEKGETVLPRFEWVVLGQSKPRFLNQRALAPNLTHFTAWGRSAGKGTLYGRTYAQPGNCLLPGLMSRGDARMFKI